MPRGSARPPNAGKGRPKGSVNKSSASVKAALQSAYDAIGGDVNFALWASANSTEFYKLWSKMLPQEVSGPEGGPISVLNEIILRGVRPDPND